jgi:hypothetical protein
MQSSVFSIYYFQNEMYVSSRTVALWFYILVFDHNVTDPVMQKSCNLLRRFFAHFNDLFLHFQGFFFSIKYLLFPNSRHILLSACTFYPPLFVSTNQYTSLFQILYNWVNIAFGWNQIQHKLVYWSVKKKLLRVKDWY